RSRARCSPSWTISATIRRTSGSMLCAVAQVSTEPWLPEASDAPEAWCSVKPFILTSPSGQKSLIHVPTYIIRSGIERARLQTKEKERWGERPPPPHRPLPANRAHLGVRRSSPPWIFLLCVGNSVVLAHCQRQSGSDRRKLQSGEDRPTPKGT